MSGSSLVAAGLIALGIAAAQPKDATNPTIAVNQEAKDVETQLGILQQELYVAQQQIMFLSLRQFEDRMTYRRVLFPSGKELVPAYIFSPKPATPGKKPGLVIVHGAFHGHLDWRFFDLIEYAVNKGYVTIFPEYRGSSGYGDVLYKNSYGITDVADTLAATDYLVKSEPEVDPNRLAIYGHSRGGLVTVLAIEQAPTKFRAAVDVAGLMDMVAFMAYKPDFRRMETANDPTFGGKLPSENLARYMEVSPLNHVDKIQTPLFVAATTGDRTVPLNLHSGRLIDALKARNKVFESKIYDNAPGDHIFIFGDSDERKDLFERTFAFLDKYVKPQGAKSQTTAGNVR